MGNKSGKLITEVSFVNKTQHERTGENSWSQLKDEFVKRQAFFRCAKIQTLITFSMHLGSPEIIVW